MSKPILLIDFGRLVVDRSLNLNKKDIVLDDYVVDAIPIEWIEKWLNRWTVDLSADKMLKDWKEEQK